MDMRNFRKRVSSVSAVGITAYQLAAAVLAQFAAGVADQRRPMMVPMMLAMPPRPKWAGTPHHKHGRNKHGGKSKRLRNLNYWRR